MKAVWGHGDGFIPGNAGKMVEEAGIGALLEKKMEASDWPKQLEMRCDQALCRIRDILWDDALNDAECFLKIEEIVQVLEEIGSDGGSRHAFG